MKADDQFTKRSDAAGPKLARARHCLASSSANASEDRMNSIGAFMAGLNQALAVIPYHGYHEAYD
jgi:hypothetical protein